MSQKNIVAVATIYGNTSGALVTTVPTAIVGNPAASGAVYKVNNLIVSNVSGSGSASLTVDIYKNQTNSYRIAYQISVSANTSFTPIDKGLVMYLQENDSIRISSSANNYLEAVCSYEVIS